MDDHRKNYRPWDAEQNCLGAVSPREALPEDDLVFFLLDLIPQLDLTPFHQYYAGELRGQPYDGLSINPLTMLEAPPDGESAETFLRRVAPALRGWGFGLLVAICGICHQRAPAIRPA